MIGNKSIRQAASENANGSFTIPVENCPACEGCMYYARLGSGSSQKACHYMLIVEVTLVCALLLGAMILRLLADNE